MAFDGITVSCLVKELNETLIGGRLYKIAQPEKDELLLTIKQPGGQYRLLISAGASLPLLYLTAQNKVSPMTAPNFCMHLRKHLQNGRIIRISQPGLERIVQIEVEHLDEMGDLCKKKLIVELMGKHSNLIFCDHEDVILDSIKRVSALVSSVREVLPGKEYFVPDTMHKKDFLTVTEEEFVNVVGEKSAPLFKAIYTNFTGISPIMAQEMCYRAGLDGEVAVAAYSMEQLQGLYKEARRIATCIASGDFSPCIIYEGVKPIEFCALPLRLYEDGVHSVVRYETMSALLEDFYAKKNAQIRIKQRSADLYRIVQTALERNVKKYDLQLQQMKDTEKREKYRVYGELLNAYGYGLTPGAKELTTINYYTNEPIKIPLDETLSASENAKRYFEKYNKMKRTYEALKTLTEEVHAQIEHLRSIETALEIAANEEDLVEIKEELIESGYIRRKGGTKKTKVTSKPFHYISSEEYDIYVGKNNFQNEELTFKFATGNDWWFHAKGMPGSHVIVKNPKGEMLPDQTFEEAASLAAYYSAGQKMDKVEVDYIQKKHVKKPGGGKPGFVVYYTNYSMMAKTDISGITREGELPKT